MFGLWYKRAKDMLTAKFALLRIYGGGVNVAVPWVGITDGGSVVTPALANDRGCVILFSLFSFFFFPSQTHL